jgi:hypothetical protein
MRGLSRNMGIFYFVIRECYWVCALVTPGRTAHRSLFSVYVNFINFKEFLLRELNPVPVETLKVPAYLSNLSCHTPYFPSIFQAPPTSPRTSSTPQ